MKMSQSQSTIDSSDDDKETEKLLAALDPNFSLEQVSKRQAKSRVRPTSPDKEAEWNSGHNSQTFQITPQMKTFIAKRLADALDKQIKEVQKRLPTEENPTNCSEDSGGIFLFTQSLHPMSSNDLNQDATNTSFVKMKKPKFKRRKVDDVESEDESEKLKSAAVSFDWVVNKNT